MFKRKVYDALTEWKEKYSKKYAAMLEGARRVGKSTVAEEFAKNNFRSYIKVDFANVEKDVLEVFDDRRRPVIEDLETSQFDFAFLDINPSIGENVGDGFAFGFLLVIRKL